MSIPEQLDAIDRHLDAEVDQAYKAQPLAQDWARVSKVIEELGETIGALILYTGQNPRKRQRGDTATLDDLLGELADTAITAMLGMTHYTKDGRVTVQIVTNKLRATHERIAAYNGATNPLRRHENMNELNEEVRGEMLASVRSALAHLRTVAASHPRRPLSIAITKLEEAVHWLEDPAIFGATNAEQRG